MISLLVFVLILGILVVIHELGHFIAAKKMGVKVEEFGFGFPPRLFGKKKGETLYSINALPIGGFVKVYGEEYSELEKQKTSEKNRAFVYKKPWQKAVIIIAGVVMNLLLGIGIYYFLLGSNGFTSEPVFLLDQYKFAFGRQQNHILIGAAVKGSPAEKAGLKTGDQIIEISNGKTTVVSSPEELVSFVDKNGAKELKIVVKNVRNGAVRVVTVTPYYNKELKRYVIGISLASTATIHYETPVEKALSGVYHAYNLSSYNLNVFSNLLASSFREKSVGPVSQSVAGPIGIFAEINDIVHSSGSKFIVNLLSITALLSISLAVMNILPFPALDGGRLVFVAYEWITGKRPNAKIEQYVNLAGMITLLTLAIVVSLNDILRIFAR